MVAAETADNRERAERSHMSPPENTGVRLLVESN
jgi:hypothetical protein